MRVNANDGAEWEIPYLPGVEGLKLLVAMSVAAYGTAVGGLNCHHGASGFNRGGWQCVNLPKSQWLELLDRWDKSKLTNLIGADGVPIYWCGRSTGTGDRLCVTVRWEHGRHSLNMGRTKEETLVERVAWLNKQLAELGERPVSLDIPPGVDWPRSSNGRRPSRTHFQGDSFDGLQLLNASDSYCLVSVSNFASTGSIASAQIS